MAVSVINRGTAAELAKELSDVDGTILTIVVENGRFIAFVKE